MSTRDSLLHEVGYRRSAERRDETEHGDVGRPEHRGPSHRTEPLPQARTILDSLRTPEAPLADEVRLLLADYTVVQAALARILQLADDWARTADERPDGDVFARALQICGLELVLAGDLDRLPVEVIAGANLARTTGGEDAQPRTILFRWDHAAAPLTARMLEAVGTLVQQLQILGDAERADSRGDQAIARRAYAGLDTVAGRAAVDQLRDLLDAITTRINAAGERKAASTTAPVAATSAR